MSYPTNRKLRAAALTLRVMGKHYLRMKTARAVREGTQSTLKPCRAKGPPRLLTAEEAKALYHQALAQIWNVPVENIRTRGWALPVITYYK